MNTALKVSPLVGILSAAREMVMSHADHLTTDAHALARCEVSDSPADKVNFAVGALLPLEQLANDLLALVAAARAIQGAK